MSEKVETQEIIHSDESEFEVPEELKEIFEFYEEAFSMPQRTAEDADKRSQYLDTADALAKEIEASAETVKILRKTAFDRVENAKRLNDVRANVSTEQPTEQLVSEPTKSQPIKLPDVSTEQTLRAMARLGYTRVDGGNGSHTKVYSEATGKTTTIPRHLNPTFLAVLLKQTGISKEKFIENL